MEPRLAEAQAGKRRVLFMDAAHFVLGAYLSMVLCFERLFIASPSGRQRFNVLGAVDAVSKEIFTIANDAYINAESVCLLLTKIAARSAQQAITVGRFWRFVRKECLYSKYYPKFDGFKQALNGCIQNAHTQHKAELETLLSWNFQPFKNVKIPTV